MTTAQKNNDGQKPKLKPLKGYSGLFAFENLERNPPNKKEFWFSIFAQALKEARPKKLVAAAHEEMITPSLSGENRVSHGVPIGSRHPRRK